MYKHNAIACSHMMLTTAPTCRFPTLQNLWTRSLFSEQCQLNANQYKSEFDESVVLVVGAVTGAVGAVVV
jgi:hypothetical protein